MTIQGPEPPDFIGDYPEFFDPDEGPPPVRDPGRLEGWFRKHEKTILCTLATVGVLTVVANMSSCNVLMHNGAAYLAEGVRVDLRRLEDRIHQLESAQVNPAREGVWNQPDTVVADSLRPNR